MAEHVEVLVIGGGQAGLAASYCLGKQGIEHVVLERAQVGESWRSGRWDSFTLVTPNWTVRLPGYHYAGDDPDGFMLRDEVVGYLQSYAASFNPPLKTGVNVVSVEPLDDGRGYRVLTSDGMYQADNVIVATGVFQRPKLPPFSRDLPADIVQLHTSSYRNPGALPDGAVLVIGSGQSGCQIAEELNEAGRRVHLGVGTAGRVVRRYKGKDCFWWLIDIGFFNQTLDQAPSPQARYWGNPHLTGKVGGHSIYLRNFARDGMTLLGHVRGLADGKLLVAPDLNESLGKIDQFSTMLINAWDEVATKRGLDLPEDEEVKQAELVTRPPEPEVTELDLKGAGISSIIWAGGYSFDFSWVHAPVFDTMGFPVQQQGVTGSDGLYFLGMHFLHTRKSGIFLGVGEDAQHITEHIAERRSGPPA